MQLVELANNVTIFDRLSSEEKEHLSKVRHSFFRFKLDEVVVREGEKSSSFFILIKGTVVVTKNDAPDTTIAKLKPYDVFGEMAYLTGDLRSTNVIADDEVIVMRIDAEGLGSLSAEVQKKINQNLVKLIVERLKRVNEELVWREK